jgi:hypothetical protein
VFFYACGYRWEEPMSHSERAPVAAHREIVLVCAHWEQKLPFAAV